MDDGEALPDRNQYGWSEIPVHHRTPVKQTVLCNKKKEEEVLDIPTFIDVKGWKAIGNKLTEYKLISVDEATDQERQDHAQKSGEEKGDSGEESGDQLGLFDQSNNGQSGNDDTLSTGDTIEFDLE